jgi:Leucine-rich repeat (LRR) protein
MGYEEALQLIEEARETGATELDLDVQELTSLPQNLFQLEQLTRLDISDNQLTSPPIELAVQGIEAIRKYFAHNGS